MQEKIYLTSESVTEGHPDKVCDQISDSVLDEVLRQDPSGRVACETFITVGLVIVGGEITTRGYVELPDLVRGLIKKIGYTDAKYGFNHESCAILNAIGKQSPDIAMGVDPGGAGDQGVMIGYACDETPNLMPMPIDMAHRLTMRLAEVRKKGILPFLGPDGKSQVTIENIGGSSRRVDTVVIACQHTDDVLDKTGERMSEEARQEIIKKVVKHVIDPSLLDSKTKYHINATGKFVVGGPQSDTGMTGRKLIVDTYGGLVAHGGGAFSGKDPTKVDRSASYMARYVAKNIVAAGLASKCIIQLAYAIGVKEPLAIMVDTQGTGKTSDKNIIEMIKKNFQLSPGGIIEQLDLRRPIYTKTAAYGHFGREDKDFTWERTDIAKKLAK